MGNIYKMKQEEVKEILDGLRVKKDDGTTKGDVLFGSSGDCPICGAEIEYDDKTRQTYRPYIVDMEHLQFRASCCGVITGGAVNFVMLTGKIDKGPGGVKRAVEWLLNFIRE